MSIRAKFRVHSVVPLEGTDPGQTVRLHPVYSGSEENKSFSKWTPTGEVSMTITNPAALGFFEAGKEFYLDFTPAVAPDAAPAEPGE